jgi:hypothetical protein
MTTPHKHAAILIAIAEGKEVQQKTGYSNWIDLDTSQAVIIFAYYTYRIKPKPKVKKWKWVAANSHGQLFVTDMHYTDEEEFAKSILVPIRDCVTKFIQKIDSTVIEVAE